MLTKAKCDFQRLKTRNITVPKTLQRVSPSLFGLNVVKFRQGKYLVRFRKTSGLD